MVHQELIDYRLFPGEREASIFAEMAELFRSEVTEAV